MEKLFEKSWEENLNNSKHQELCLDEVETILQAFKCLLSLIVLRPLGEGTSISNVCVRYVAVKSTKLSCPKDLIVLESLSS